MFPQPYVAMRLGEQRQRDLMVAATKRHGTSSRSDWEIDQLHSSPVVTKLRVQLLGRFSVTAGAKEASPWPRPPAKRLCELVLVSPGRRIGRDIAREELFPNLSAKESAKALSRSLSLARATLSELGGRASRLLEADRTFISADAGLVEEVDLEVHEEGLRTALRTAPGKERDDLLVQALTVTGVLLEDEPYASWALRPRERLDWLRQEARLALARDRARGEGRSQPRSVIEAWEDCLAQDPTCEEAAGALMRVYAAQSKQVLVEGTYKRCRSAIEELGLHISPDLQQAHDAATLSSPSPRGRPAKPASPFSQERRLVTVVFAEVAGPLGAGHPFEPEALNVLVGGALTKVVACVESLGGTVTAVTGTGLVALFGAPEAHEDDPERALHAAIRSVAAIGSATEGVSLRAGVETGPAVVGLIGVGATGHYAAVGDAVCAAAALQSVARPGGVVVGPRTRAATEGLFDWDPSEEVTISVGGKALRASYLQRPKVRPSRSARPKGLAGGPPLVGRAHELSDLREAIQEATAGRGGVVVITGEPGLGKTRLVEEGRQLFMAWVAAATGRLPLWLEGSAASYKSSTPYGLYQRLLSAWAGIPPDAGEGVARPALQRAVKAIFGGTAAGERLGLLSEMMGLTSGKHVPESLRLDPQQLQRATFGAIISMVARLVSFGPTVLVLEDLHWADATSVQLTGELISLSEEAPLLLILTRRPEPDQGAASLETALGASPCLRVRKLELRPLRKAQERDLARALLADASDEVLDTVSGEGEGNPLLLENRLASFLETSALVRNDGSGRLEHSTPGVFRDGIERLVQSRFDRLDPSQRAVVVAASASGPEFTLRAIDAVTDFAIDFVAAKVSELCSAGLFIEVRRLPEPTYRFRHAFFQKVTYQGLLSQQRTRLHARAAWGLEAVSAGRLEEVAGLLGYHYALAGEDERAAHYLELAANQTTFAVA